MKAFLGIAGVLAVVTAIAVVGQKSGKKRKKTLIEKIKSFFNALFKGKETEQEEKASKQEEKASKQEEKASKQEDAKNYDDAQPECLDRVPNLYRDFCCDICQVFQYILALYKLYNSGGHLTDGQYEMVVENEIIYNLRRVKKKYSFINDFSDKQKYQLESVDYMELINKIKIYGIIENIESADFKNPDEVKKIASVIESLLKNCGLIPLYITDEGVTKVMEINYNVANSYYIETPAIFYNRGDGLAIFDVCVGLAKEEL